MRAEVSGPIRGFASKVTGVLDVLRISFSLLFSVGKLFTGPTMVLGIGEYPPEFNAKVHGPYDPSRFYGKRKLPLVSAEFRQPIVTQLFIAQGHFI